MRRINERFGIAQHQHLQPTDAVLVAGAGMQTPADPAQEGTAMPGSGRDRRPRRWGSGHGEAQLDLLKGCLPGATRIAT